MQKLKQNIIAEDGETYLSMLNKIMVAMDWRIKIKGDGTIQVMPFSTNSVIEFNPDYDAIEQDLSVKNDWYECPNVFRAISGEDSETVYDEESNLSVASRGREIWAEETSCNLNTGETLYEYAVRRLKEQQRTDIKVSYNRRYNPDIYVTDVITINYPQIQGKFLVNSQSIELGYGSPTTEEVIR